MVFSIGFLPEDLGGLVRFCNYFCNSYPVLAKFAQYAIIFLDRDISFPS